MTNNSAKLCKAANERTLRHLRVLMACVLAFQAAVHVWLLAGGLPAWAVLAAVGGGCAAVHRWLARQADDGAHLREGLPAYAFDLVYLAAFGVVASAWSHYAWLVFLSVPAYAVYKVWSVVGALRQPAAAGPRKGRARK